jgi:hypothetical protein
MTRWKAFWGLLLVCGTVRAADVAVRVAAADAGCLSGARIVVTPEGGKPIGVAVQPDKRAYVVPVPDSVAATVAVESAGCWGDRRYWSPYERGETELALHRAATVTGAFSGAGAGTVRDLRAQVFLRKGGGQGNDDLLPAPGAGNSSCTIVKGKWRCIVPADVPFDLRLDASGFASSFFWDVTASPAGEPHDLGVQALIAGADVAGWVVGPRDVPQPNARVTIYPRESQHAGEHAAASLRTVRTNRRGFFQVAGLPPGAYRIVSEVPGLSPAVLPEITPRTGESISLAAPIRHAPPAELEVTLDPPTDALGRPWTVEATEVSALYPGRRPASVTKTAGGDGRWTARGLRADAYDIRVRDEKGSLVQRASVDLFEGGRSTLVLTVHQLAIRGLLRSGDTPLEGDIQLWSQDRRMVLATSDADGRFDAALPGPGTWHPTILYPLGPSPARITAEPFEIPVDASPETVHHVTIELPGGRIHGTVVDAGDRAGPAVVHAFRGEKLVAQQRTNDIGHFDFVGLSPGTYHLDAQSAAGSTATPVPVAVEDEESREVKLVTEPYVRLSGFVVTPDGRPASGAIVKFSPNGVFWERIVTDVRGYFERDLNRGSKQVQIIVLTYGLPATLLSTPLTSEPIRIRLRGDGGIVRFRTPAVLMGRGVTAPAHVFKFESTAPFNGRVYLEAGTYTVCPTIVINDACRSLSVQPASEQDWELKAPAGAGGTT